MSRATTRLRMATVPQIQTLRVSTSPTTPPPAYSPGGFRWPPVPSRLAGLQRHLSRAASRGQSPVRSTKQAHTNPQISLITDVISGYPQTTICQTVRSRTLDYDARPPTRRPSQQLQLHSSIEELPMSQEEEDLKRHLCLRAPPPTRQSTETIGEAEADVKRHLGLLPRAQESAMLQAPEPLAILRVPDLPRVNDALQQLYDAEALEVQEALDEERPLPSPPPTAVDMNPKRSVSLSSDDQRKKRSSVRRKGLERAQSDKSRIIERNRRRREGRERVLAWREQTAPPSPALSRATSQASQASQRSAATEYSSAMSRNASVSTLSSYVSSSVPLSRKSSRGRLAHGLSLNTQPQRLVTAGPIPGHSRDGSQSSQGSLMALDPAQASATEVMRPIKRCESPLRLLPGRPSPSPQSSILSARMTSPHPGRAFSSPDPSLGSPFPLRTPTASSSKTPSSSRTPSTSRTPSPFSSPGKPTTRINKPLPAINTTVHRRANGSVVPFPQSPSSPLEVQTSRDSKRRQIKGRQRRRTVSEDTTGSITVRSREGPQVQVDQVNTVIESGRPSREHNVVDFDFDSSTGVKLKTRAIPVWKRYLNECFDIIDTKWKGVPQL